MTAGARRGRAIGPLPPHRDLESADFLENALLEVGAVRLHDGRFAARDFAAPSAGHHRRDAGVGRGLPPAIVGIECVDHAMLRAKRDRLLVEVLRRGTDVRVIVDHAGDDLSSRDVDDFRIRRDRDSGTHVGDFAVPNEDDAVPDDIARGGVHGRTAESDYWWRSRLRSRVRREDERANRARKDEQSSPDHGSLDREDDHSLYPSTRRDAITLRLEATL